MVAKEEVRKVESAAAQLEQAKKKSPLMLAPVPLLHEGETKASITILSA